MYTSTAKVQVTNPIAAFQPSNALANPNMQTEQALATSTLVSKCAVLLLSNPGVTDGAAATGTPGDRRLQAAAVRPRPRSTPCPCRPAS